MSTRLRDPGGMITGEVHQARWELVDAHDARWRVSLLFAPTGIIVRYERSE